MQQGVHPPLCDVLAYDSKTGVCRGMEWGRPQSVRRGMVQVGQMRRTLGARRKDLLYVSNVQSRAQFGISDTGMTFHKVVISIERIARHRSLQRRLDPTQRRVFDMQTSCILPEVRMQVAINSFRVVWALGSKMRVQSPCSLLDSCALAQIWRPTQGTPADLC